MSHERKFKAAVNVIRNLPKNGAYQPSHDLMLRFYAYYKQATEGPNKKPKPNFWELINKAKWDAWYKLGNMTKEEAMIHYVEELKKIVETMSYTDNVANFLTSLDSFYESVPAEDLEMLIGPVINRVQSQPGSPLSGSPLGSREASPQRLKLKGVMNATNKSYSASPLPPDTDDDDEDNFVDTLEQEEPDKTSRKKTSSNPTEVNSIILKTHHNLSSVIVNGDANFNKEKETTYQSTKLKDIEVRKDEEVPLSHIHLIRKEVNSVMKQTSMALRHDLDAIMTRVSSLEIKVHKVERNQPKYKQSTWWLFLGLSEQTIAFLVIWPFIVTFLLQSMQQRKT